MTNSSFEGPALVLANAIGKSFGAMAAVSGASFSIRHGDLVAVVGWSGSGKSTLLQLIAGIDVPTVGTLAWPAFAGAGPLRPGKISMMFQSPSLVPWLNVVENVVLPLALLEIREGREQLAMDALARFGLDALARKLPEELSGGQAQRVALARAIVSRPKLLLADEPTGQLDQATASDLIAELIDWATEARAAIVIATHDPQVAAGMTLQWRIDHGVLNA